jgi:hypothetical protein
MPESNKNQLSNRFSLEKLFIGIPQLLFLLVTNCHFNPAPQTEATFSDLTPMSGKQFVAYPSPDRRIKPDSILFSWNMGSIDPEKVTVIARLQPERDLQVPVIRPTQNARGQIVWVPGTDTAAFNYFGKKKCVFLLFNQNNEHTAISDTFVIIGTLPVALQSPAHGMHYSLNDSIPINYQTNTDLTSNIRIFFRNDSMPNWIEIIGTTKRIADEPPLRSFTTVFIPRTWESYVTASPSLPIRFFLKDYNSPLPNSSYTSGDIFID